MEDKEMDELVEQERTKNPEAFEALRDAVHNKKTILFKNRDDEVKEVTYSRNFEEHNNNIWQPDIRMRNGKPRIVIDVYNLQDMAYLEEHCPVINYFPTSLLIEEYKIKWKVKGE